MSCGSCALSVPGAAHAPAPGRTTIGCDRVGETKTSRKGKLIDTWYSGKTHDFGGPLQALMAPDGVPLWISEVRLGSVHDITAARDLVLAVLAPYLRHLPVLADGGYDSAGPGVYTPVKKPRDGYELAPDTRTYNRLLRGLRCLGERGFALLTQRWTTLQHVTLGPRRIGQIAQAALVLTRFEHRIITRPLGEPQHQFSKSTDDRALRTP